MIFGEWKKDANQSSYTLQCLHNSELVRFIFIWKTSTREWTSNLCYKRYVKIEDAISSVNKRLKIVGKFVSKEDFNKLLILL